MSDATTFIWIVAIERYGSVGGGKGPLDIPAPIGVRAIEFAAQCATRHPLARVVLSASLPDTAQYRKLLQTLPAAVKKTDATQAALRDALSMLQGTGTLLVYWIGHGIMSNDKRLILCADSQGLDDLRALDVDALLRHLRSERYPRQQLGFVDACANVFPPPAVTQLDGSGNTPTDQYFYFAASAGQVAPADTTRPGFSSIVLTTLLDLGRPFPPPPVDLFIELRRLFDEARLSTRAFPLQWTEGSGESWSRQGAAKDAALIRHARAAWCSLGEFEHLRDAGAGCVDDGVLSEALRAKALDVLVKDLRKTSPDQSKVDLLSDAWARLNLAQSLEAACVRLGLSWQDWIALLDLVTAMDNLQQAPAPDSLVDLLLTVLGQTRPERGWDSLIRLLALAARRIRQHDGNRAKLFSLELRHHAVLGPRVEAAIEGLPSAEGPAFLLIGLQCEGAAKTITVEGSWIFVNDDRDATWEFTSSDIPVVDKINELIERAKVRYRTRPLIIELLAPNDLLCGPKELLELVDLELDTRVSLEEQNAVILRWHDRMKGSSRYQPGTWVKASLQTEQLMLGLTALACTWAEEPPQGHILGIPYPGPNLAVPTRNRGRFFKELMKGAPLMCWPRLAPTDLDKFKQTVCDLMSTPARADPLPHTLSGRVPPLAEALRQAKQSGDAHLQDLWLFVDDPSRNPYEWQYSEPSDQGTS